MTDSALDGQPTAIPAGAKRSGRAQLWLATRVAISAALLAYVLWSTDWSTLGALVAGTSVTYLALSFLTEPVLTAVSAWKWGWLLRAVGIDLSFARLFYLYIVGRFFNNVLPTSVGGDVVRAAALARSTGRHAEAVTSVFLERYTGLTALVLLTLISVPLNFKVAGDPRMLLAILIVTGGYLALLVLMLGSGYLTWLERLPLPRPARKLLGKARGFQAAIQRYRGHYRTLEWSVVNSLAWNLVATANVYFSALAFGQRVSFWALLLTVPIVLTVTMLPITVGGIGLNEWAYTFALGQLGVPAAAGLSIALLIRFKSVIASLPGGVGYAFGGAGVDAARLARSE